MQGQILADSHRYCAMRECNDPTIGSYNNYHLSPNGIPRGNRRWYGLVSFGYKNTGLPRAKPRKQ